MAYKKPAAVRGQLLVVEDNPDIAALIEETLQERGYATVSTDTVAEAKRLLNAQFFDLVLVDLNLKDGSGEEVCLHIRNGTRRPTTPIIILTGQAGYEDKARGIQAGADYYLTKPIAAAEILLWVKALLRRVSGDWSRGTTIGVPGLRVNPDIRTVWVDKEVVRGLTTKEFDVLIEIARAYPKKVSQRELLARLWPHRPASNTVEVHVHGLRRKLGPKGAAHVVTDGDGYRLE